MKYIFFLHFSQEDIEIKKDVDRQEEIKSIKRAWESLEPGRAAKVCCSFKLFKIEYYQNLWITCKIGNTSPTGIFENPYGQN